jgi:hypothetical protein
MMTRSIVETGSRAENAAVVKAKLRGIRSRVAGPVVAR